MGKTRDTGFLTDCVFTDSSNNVGIGGSPSGSYKFEVTGTGRINSANTSLVLDTTSTSFDASLRLNNNSSATTWGIIQAGPGAISGGGMNMYTTGAYPFTLGTNGTERIRISSTGSVDIRSGNVLNIYRSDNTRALQFYTDNNACYIDSWEASSEPLRLRSNGSGGRIEFHTNGAERLRITSGGTLQQTIPNSNDGLFHQIPTNSYTGYIYSHVNNFGGSYYLGIERVSGSGLCNGALTYSTVLTTNNATNLTFGTNGAARVTITSQSGTGNLVVGGSSSPNSSAGRGTIISNGTGTALIGLSINGGERGYIYHNDGEMYLNQSTNGQRLYCISSSGGVYLNSGATSWTANSDERLKDITGNIENAVDSLMTLRAVKHTWKADEDKVEKLALIAQDVEKVFPQIVDKGKLPSKPNEEQTDETEYLGVRYQELIPVLVKAIQELSAKVSALENKS